MRRICAGMTACTVLAAGFLGALGLGSSLGRTVVWAGEPHTGETTARVAQTTTHIDVFVFKGKIEGKPGITGPDGKTHDTIVPATMVVHKGVRVRLVITNYDESSHTITAPALGLNIVIKPGKEVEKQEEDESTEKSGKEQKETVRPVETTVTFTPQKTGIFRWFCSLPCDHGAGYWAMQHGYSGMGKEGFMAGVIVVLSH